MHLGAKTYNIECAKIMNIRFSFSSYRRLNRRLWRTWWQFLQLQCLWWHSSAVQSRALEQSTRDFAPFWYGTLRIQTPCKLAC